MDAANEKKLKLSIKMGRRGNIYKKFTVNVPASSGSIKGVKRLTGISLGLIRRYKWVNNL